MNVPKTLRYLNPSAFQVHETQDFEPVTPARVDPPKKSNLDYSDFMMGDANDFQTAKEGWCSHGVFGLVGGERRRVNAMRMT